MLSFLKQRRFNYLDSGCNGVVFVQMRKKDGDPNPKEIIQHMMSSLASMKRHVSRFFYLLKFIPRQLYKYVHFMWGRLLCLISLAQECHSLQQVHIESVTNWSNMLCIRGGNWKSNKASCWTVLTCWNRHSKEGHLHTSKSIVFTIKLLLLACDWNSI